MAATERSWNRQRDARSTGSAAASGGAGGGTGGPAEPKGVPLKESEDTEYE